MRRWSAITRPPMTQYDQPHGHAAIRRATAKKQTYFYDRQLNRDLIRFYV
jgi:hypothetical protein